MTTPNVNVPNADTLSIIDYEFVNGKLSLTKTALQAKELIKPAKNYERRLQFAEAGSALLSLLIDNPWLQSFTLVLEPYIKKKAAYTDLNGIGVVDKNRTLELDGIDVMFRDIMQVPGTDLPFNLNTRSVVNTLRKQLEDGAGAGVILNNLNEGGDLVNFSIKVDRVKIQHMFESGKFSAIEAFKVYLLPHTQYTNYFLNVGMSLVEPTV